MLDKSTASAYTRLTNKCYCHGNIIRLRYPTFCKSANKKPFHLPLNWKWNISGTVLVTWIISMFVFLLIALQKLAIKSLISWIVYNKHHIIQRHTYCIQNRICFSEAKYCWRDLKECFLKTKIVSSFNLLIITTNKERS